MNPLQIICEAAILFNFSGFCLRPVCCSTRQAYFGRLKLRPLIDFFFNLGGLFIILVVDCLFKKNIQLSQR